MMLKKNHQGYVIPLVLMILSLSIAIVTYIFIRATVYVPYMSFMEKREQARMLALGGVNIALSQLTKSEKGGDKEEKKKDEDPAKQFIKNILPALNRWQIFALKKDIEGIDAQIQISISCEAGKIPINEIYDFESQKFIEFEDASGGQRVVIPPGSQKAEKKPEKKSWRDILKELFKRIESQTDGKNLLEAFEKFLKTRQYKVNDVSELLTIKEFDVFKHSVWYEAPHQKKEKKGEKHPLYLQDLFTITSSKKINPWFFSDSIAGILNLPRAKPGDVKDREKQVQKWLQNYKAVQDWKTEWEKQLKPVYGVDLESLPKGIEMTFDNTTVPTYFSVVSQGTVDEVTQRVVAYVVLTCSDNSEKEQCRELSIYRMYWL